MDVVIGKPTPRQERNQGAAPNGDAEKITTFRATVVATRCPNKRTRSFAVFALRLPDRPMSAKYSRAVDSHSTQNRLQQHRLTMKF